MITRCGSAAFSAENSQCKSAAVFVCEVCRIYADKFAGAVFGVDLVRIFNLLSHTVFRSEKSCVNEPNFYMELCVLFFFPLASY